MKDAHVRQVRYIHNEHLSNTGARASDRIRYTHFWDETSFLQNYKLRISGVEKKAYIYIMWKCVNSMHSQAALVYS